MTVMEVFMAELRVGDIYLFLGVFSRCFARSGSIVICIWRLLEDL
jgi:hypothetical protein